MLFRKKYAIFPLVSIIIFIFSIGAIFYNKRSVRYPEHKLGLSIKHFMIRQGGLYTLFGSKPMTLFNLKDGCISTKQKKERFHKLPMLERLIYSQKQVDYCFNSLEQWNYWTDFWKKDKSSKYIFCKRWNLGFFVNISETAWILHKYYDHFRHTVGEDFDPITAVKDISNSDSYFWHAVGPPSQNHQLWGLLLGYGEKLAYLYEQDQSGYFYNDDKFLVDFRKVNIKIDSLPIPSFKIFSPEDEMIDFYHQERAKIVSTLRGKDFLHEVLFYLKCEDSVISPRSL